MKLQNVIFQKEDGWVKSIVEQLSKDLNGNIGKGISWSPRNLWFMRQLVSKYSILNQVGSEIEYMKQLVSEVPWKDNILILQKVKDIKVIFLCNYLSSERFKDRKKLRLKCCRKLEFSE